MQVRVLRRAVRLLALLMIAGWGGHGDTSGATVVIVRSGGDPTPDPVVVVAGDKVEWQTVLNDLQVDVGTSSNVWTTAVLDTNTAGNFVGTYNQTFPEGGYFPFRYTPKSGQGGFFLGGSVTVLPASNAPPVVLNAPVEGHYPPVSGIVFEATPRRGRWCEVGVVGFG